MIPQYTLFVTPRGFQLLWEALGKRPAEEVFALMEELKGQVETQEKKHAEQLKEAAKAELLAAAKARRPSRKSPEASAQSE